MDTTTTEPIAQSVSLGQAQPVAMPQGLARTLLQALNPLPALAMTMPAIFGAVMGWWQTRQFSPLLFSFLVVGALSAALAYQALCAVYDYRQSLKPEAKPAEDLPTTPFAWMAAGALPPSLLLSLGWLLFTLGGLAALWLALLAGWPMLFFNGLSVLLFLAALLPPIRYAERGWGLGEVGVALSFGLLPMLAGYYSQGQSMSWLAVAGGLPLFLLVLVMVLNGNLGTWYRDWKLGKRTLPVLIGAARALDLSAACTWGAYTTILLVTILARLPLWCLAGMATLPLALGAFADVPRHDVSAEDGYRLRDATAKAAIWTGILLCLALWISRAAG